MKDLYSTFLAVDNERLREQLESAKKDGINTGRAEAAKDQRLKRERSPALTDDGGGRVSGKEDLAGLNRHDWAMAIAEKLKRGDHLPRRRWE
jgi:hypothetical protein